jgi:hypothetical protein
MKTEEVEIETETVSLEFPALKIIQELPDRYRMRFFNLNVDGFRTVRHRNKDVTVGTSKSTPA